MGGNNEKKVICLQKALWLQSEERGRGRYKGKRRGKKMETAEWEMKVE